MYTVSRTLVSATAIVAMVQYCPAPFLAVIPEAVAVGLETASDVIDVVGGKCSDILVYFMDQCLPVSMVSMILVILRFDHDKATHPEIFIGEECVGEVARRGRLSDFLEGTILCFYVRN